jgi:hypothetical protein
MVSWVKLLAVPRPPPGPWDAKAAPVHELMRGGITKTARDIQIFRDDAMTISRDD